MTSVEVMSLVLHCFCYLYKYKTALSCMAIVLGGSGNVVVVQ